MYNPRSVRSLPRGYLELDAYLGGKAQRTLANNTLVTRHDDESIGVILHATEIARFWPSGRVRLNSGGWQTTTTKSRIANLLPDGWNIASVKRTWYLYQYGKKVEPFFDGMEFELESGARNTETNRPRRTKRRLGLIKDTRFFREHAGGQVGHATEGALDLARAEREAFRRGWTVEWVEDAEADWSWMSEREQKQPHEVYGARLKDKHGKVLADLWGIFDPDKKYMRVVEAELAAEALARSA